LEQNQYFHFLYYYYYYYLLWIDYPKFLRFLLSYSFNLSLLDHLDWVMEMRHAGILHLWYLQRNIFHLKDIILWMYAFVHYHLPWFMFVKSYLCPLLRIIYHFFLCIVYHHLKLELDQFFNGNFYCACRLLLFDGLLRLLISVWLFFHPTHFMIKCLLFSFYMSRLHLNL